MLVVSRTAWYAKLLFFDAGFHRVGLFLMAVYNV